MFGKCYYGVFKNKFIIFIISFKSFDKDIIISKAIEIAEISLDLLAEFSLYSIHFEKSHTILTMNR